MAATRPLTLKEMDVALALVSQDDVSSFEELDLDRRNLERRIRYLCGLFVYVSDGRIQLFHQTAKEFLVKTDLRSGIGSGLWKQSLNEQDCELIMAKTCIRYLLLDDFENTSELLVEGSEGSLDFESIESDERSDESDQDESNQDESNQDESNQDESTQDESNQDESNQDESNQDESTQDESNQDRSCPPSLSYHLAAESPGFLGELTTDEDGVESGDRQVVDSNKEAHNGSNYEDPLYNFMSYSAVNWPEHFHKADMDQGSEMFSLSLNLYDTDSPRYRAWFPTYWETACSPHFRPSKQHGPDAKWTGLHFAAVAGHTNVVQVLLESEKIGIDSQDDERYTPLFYAIKKKPLYIGTIPPGEGCGCQCAPWRSAFRA